MIDRRVEPLRHWDLKHIDEELQHEDQGTKHLGNRVWVYDLSIAKHRITKFVLSKQTLGHRKSDTFWKWLKELGDQERGKRFNLFTSLKRGMRLLQEELEHRTPPQSLDD